MSLIYKITNTINSKVYVGKTNYTLEKRFKYHLRDRLKPNFLKRPLYRAFQKYGIENFTIELLCECLESEADEKEIFWISYYDSYKNGYNATVGGQGTSIVDREKVIAQYLVSLNIKETARICGYHADTVKNVLESEGIETVRHLGVNNPSSALTEEQVKLIRSLYVPKTFGKRKISAATGISVSLVNGVITGKNYKSVGD